MNNNVSEKKLSLSSNGKGTAGIWNKILAFFTGSGSLEKRKARAGWVFILPFVIGLLFIYVPVVIESLKLSFCELKPVRLPNGSAGTVMNFVAFDNYREALFEDTDFVKTLVSGIQQLVFDIPAIVIFSLFVFLIPFLFYLQFVLHKHHPGVLDKIVYPHYM